MATINVNRQGGGSGITSGVFATARSNAAFSVTDGITGQYDVQYFTSGRGKRFKRVFLHFDTSGITGTLSAAHIDVNGGGTSDPDPNDTIMIKSTAFGGDGGTALSNDDFNNVDFSTAYASAVGTGGSTTGTATFTLNATALADIKNNDAFIVALLESDHDFSDSEPSDVSKTLAISFAETGGTSSDPKLSYTLATGYSHDIMAVAAASIVKVNSLATANVGKISGT